MLQYHGNETLAPRLQYLCNETLARRLQYYGNETLAPGLQHHGNETLAPGLQYPPGLQYAGVPGPVSVPRQVLAGVLPGQQDAGGVSRREGSLQHWGEVHIVLTSYILFN